MTYLMPQRECDKLLNILRNICSKKGPLVAVMPDGSKLEILSHLNERKAANFATHNEGGT